jgi:hypothetical protein
MYPVILIELVYERGCPRVAAARANLAWALIEAKVSQRWTEWILSEDGTPARVRGLPSPSILINCQAAAADPDVQPHRVRKLRRRRR